MPRLKYVFPLSPTEKRGKPRIFCEFCRTAPWRRKIAPDAMTAAAREYFGAPKHQEAGLMADKLTVGYLACERCRWRIRNHHDPRVQKNLYRKRVPFSQISKPKE